MDTMVPDLGDTVESAHTIGCSYVGQGVFAGVLSKLGFPHR